MDKKKIKSSYNEKIELIKKFNKQYYEKNKPTVSDSKYDELKKHVDEVYCLSVNDTFVMNAWFTAQGIEKVKALPDGSGNFTTGLGAAVRKDNLGFGLRSWRYAIVVNDGVIESVFSEEGFRDDADTDPYEVSSPENVLNNL